MSYKNKLGRGTYNDYGQGRFIRPEMLPVHQPLVWKGFAGGLDLRDVRQDVEANTTPFAVDTVVTHRDRIHRAPGVETLQSLAPREPRQMVVHADLNNTAELLLFDPPWMGVKRHGAVSWANVGLTEGRRYGVTNYGGQLIFGNRQGVTYARNPRSAGVEVVAGAASGLAYASFAGRILVGNAILEGNVEPMGVAWSDVDGFWGEESGSGFELLIDDLATGDEILELVPIGLDYLAVVCRNSIWTGTRTGLVLRPVDFRSRVPKVGALTAACVALTSRGVALLSDDGVRMFDGNAAPIVSEAINSDLLPLDMERIDAYRLAFNPSTKHLTVLTPVCAYTYDVERNRWFKRSLVALDGAAFSEQFDYTTWGELVGSWGDQTARWGELMPDQSKEVGMYYLAEVNGVHYLGVEDEDQTCSFGVPNAALWQLPLFMGKVSTSLYTSSEVLVEYLGNGILGLRQPNENGDYVGVGVWNLPNSGSQVRIASLTYIHTGQALGLQLDFGQGCLEISRVVLMGQERSSRVDAGVARLPGYSDYDNRSVQ